MGDKSPGVGHIQTAGIGFFYSGCYFDNNVPWVFIMNNF